MIVYRLCKEKYKNDLSGKGAEIAGGRWNSKGYAMVYTSESRSLCTVEIAVHTPLGILPKDYFILSIEIPDSIQILTLPDIQLPSDGKSIPHSHSTQVIGDQFLSEEKYLVIKVPSVVVDGDYNYLINPRHEDFLQINIVRAEVFSFDSRLIGKVN